MNDITLLERVENLCDSNNLTVYKLEKEIGLAPSTIRKWEKATPSCYAISLVADYFGVSVDYLLCRTDNSISHKSDMPKVCSEINLELSKYDVPDSQIESLRKIIKIVLTEFK